MAFAGANREMYVTMQNTTVDIGDSALSLTPTGQRVYLNDATYPYPGIPAWVQPDPNARVCVSIRPELWNLINGNYNTELKAFLTAAPGGPTSLVALWHEASSLGSYDTYFDSLNQSFPGMGGAAGLLTTAQTYVQKKAQLWGANVKVGAIEAVETKDASALAARLDPWMAENLDFYACDVYDFAEGDAIPGDLLTAFQTVCDNLASGNATIGVTEANSPFPGRRPYWFTGVWSWLQSNGFTSNSTCFLTFWNTTGSESGAWIPDDWATIDALYAIFAQSSP